MSLVDGKVTGSDQRGDPITHITLHNTDRSAYMAGVYTVFQKTVDLSDALHRQRASLEQTITNISKVDSAFGAIGNSFTTVNANDAANPGATKSVWVAENASAAADVTLGLILVGVEPPPSVTAAWELRPVGQPSPVFVSSDLTNVGASFWYFDGNQWNHVTNEKPQAWVEGGSNNGLTWPKPGPLDVIPDAGWTYKGFPVQPYKGDEPIIEIINGSTDLSELAPGTLVKNLTTGKYNMVTIDHGLTEVPPPTEGTFLATRMQADQETAVEWKKILQSAHDKLAMASQTQSEYISSLSGSMQNQFNMLTNLFQRLERTLNSLVDRT